MVEGIESLLKQLGLPGFMASSGGALADFVPVLAHAEHASTAAMDLSRLIEFSHGRMHARMALARLGLHGAIVPMAPDRSPLWPPGFTGSISHVPADRVENSDGQVIAVAARLSDCAGVGVDLERAGMLLPEHWNAFLTATELAALVLQPVAQRGTLVHGLWSAKEAVMKALRQALDPQNIEVRLSDDARTFSAECRLTAADSGAASTWVQGRLANAQGWVAAFAMR
ncbi:MAG: 4'-phosphopantetheinyl transferase family protein [Rhodoferax sp.]